MSLIRFTYWFISSLLPGTNILHGVAVGHVVIRLACRRAATYGSYSLIDHRLQSHLNILRPYYLFLWSWVGSLRPSRASASRHIWHVYSRAVGLAFRGFICGPHRLGRSVTPVLRHGVDQPLDLRGGGLFCSSLTGTTVSTRLCVLVNNLNLHVSWICRFGKIDAWAGFTMFVYCPFVVPSFDRQCRSPHDNYEPMLNRVLDVSIWLNWSFRLIVVVLFNMIFWGNVVVILTKTFPSYTSL